MKRNLIRNACWSGLATLIVQQIASFLWGEGGPPASSPYIGLLFPILWVFFLLFHFLTLRLFAQDSHRSTIYYLGLLGGKMFLAMFTVLLYGFFKPEGLRTFVSIFLPLYAVLTIIQVVETLFFIRGQKNESHKEEQRESGE